LTCAVNSNKCIRLVLLFYFKLCTEIEPSISSKPYLLPKWLTFFAPAGPWCIRGVLFSLTTQCWHLRLKDKKKEKFWKNYAFKNLSHTEKRTTTFKTHKDVGLRELSRRALCWITLWEIGDLLQGFKLPILLTHPSKK